MAWSTPLTAVANASLTAAQWNASVRDNLLETAAAKATASGQYFAATGANTLAARACLDGIVETSETTGSTTYTDLATAGPTATVTVGLIAWVVITAEMSNNTVGATTRATFETTGATTTTPQDFRALKLMGTDSVRCSVVQQFQPNTGVNTFRTVYRVSSNTGTFANRRIIVMPF